VVVAPVGFVSDHVEVIWDLDTEARERAEELGIAFARAATAGPDPRFADMVVELVAEHTDAAAPRRLSADVPSVEAAWRPWRSTAAHPPGVRRKVGPFVIVTGGRRRVRVGDRGRAVARRSPGRTATAARNGAMRRPGHE
jgi:hypothetical protein